MDNNKPGLVVKAYSYVVVGFEKVANLFSDAWTFSKSYSAACWRSWKMIWKNFEFRNILTVLKLTFGTLFMAFGVAKTEFTRNKAAKIAMMNGNLQLGAPQGFFQQARFNIMQTA